VSSGSEGYFWLEKILQIDPSAVVVLINSYGDVQMAVKAIKAGATDFAEALGERKVAATLFSAMRLRESRDEIHTLASRTRSTTRLQNEKYADIIGSSSSMQKIFRTIDRVAHITDANVLILVKWYRAKK